MSLRTIMKMFYDEENFSCPGNKYIYEYENVIEDGEKKVVAVRKIDIQQEIESYRDSVDIHKIVERFINGDVTALDRAQAFYADVSQMPVKLQDVLSMNQRGLNIFNSLSPEVRALFGNDYLDFISHPEKLDDYVKSVNPQNVDEKVEKVDEIED